MNNTIITKDINKEVILTPDTNYGYIELYTTINGITVYNGTTWWIEQIKLNEGGTLTAQINGDPIAIILHNVRDIQVKCNTKNTTQYIVNIDYNI